MQHLAVEYLPSELAGLCKDHMAVLGVGVIAEVGALVDEPFAAAIDHDAPRIAVLLEIVADRQVTELRCVAIPADRVATGPIAGRHGTDVERHPDAVTGIESGAAHLGQIPSWAEIARTPFRIGLETAGGQYDAFGFELGGPPAMAHAQPFDALVVGEQIKRAGFVEDADAVLAGAFGPCSHQARPAAPGLDREAAPEFEPAIDLEGLTAVDRREPDALAAHPAHSVAAVLDQELGEVRVGPILGHAPDVIEEILFRVAAEIGRADLLLGEIGHQCLEVVDAVIDAPHGTSGETAVAAGLRLRRTLEHEDRARMLGGRERGAERRIAGTDNDHIDRGRQHVISIPGGFSTAAQRGKADRP